MNPLKDFEEFIKSGIVKKQGPDKLRANDLIGESNRKFKSLNIFLDKIGLNNENANDVMENCYDIIIGLIRARMLLAGFNSSGSGAHEAEIAYLKKLNFSEREVEFANQLRYFRNGIMYYGKKFDKEYAEKVYEFLIKVKSRLEIY